MICQHFLVVLFSFCCAASASATFAAAAIVAALLVGVVVVGVEAPATKFEARVIYCQCAHFSLGLTVCRQDTPTSATATMAAAEAAPAFAFMLKLSNCASFHCRLKCTAARAVWNAFFALFARHNPQQSEGERERECSQLVSALLASTELRNQNKCDEKPACLFVFACLLRYRCCCCPACLPTRPTARQAAVDALPTLAFTATPRCLLPTRRANDTKSARCDC